MLKAGAAILTKPLPFDCRVLAGERELRRYVDYHPVFADGSSDMLALTLWAQIPSGTELTLIEPGGARHSARVA